MSVIIQLADAITALLNAGVFNPTITVERLYLPLFDLSLVGNSIKVSVVPRSMDVNSLARSLNSFDIAVDVSVQKRISAGDNNDIDTLVSLVEQIGDHLRLTQLSVSYAAQWISSAHEPLIVADHIERINVFTSVLTVTYRVMR